MEVRLLRIDEVGKGVRGILFVPGKEVRHRQPVTTIENAEYLIPDGTYALGVTYSPKFGYRMPEIMGVPNRAGVRIHKGTKPEHSTGCVLTTPNGFATIFNLIATAAQAGEPVKMKVKTVYDKSLI